MLISNRNYFLNLIYVDRPFTSDSDFGFVIKIGVEVRRIEQPGGFAIIVDEIFKGSWW